MSDIANVAREHIAKHLPDVPVVWESWCDACEVTIETSGRAEVDAFHREHAHPVDEEYGHIEL